MKTSKKVEKNNVQKSQKETAEVKVTTLVVIQKPMMLIGGPNVPTATEEAPQPAEFKTPPDIQERIFAGTCGQYPKSRRFAGYRLLRILEVGVQVCVVGDFQHRKKLGGNTVCLCLRLYLYVTLCLFGLLFPLGNGIGDWLQSVCDDRLYVFGGKIFGFVIPPPPLWA